MMAKRRARLLAAIGPALLLLLAAFVSQIAAHAQTRTPANRPPNPQADRLVCPLSESQTQNAIAAFAKLAASFTEEDRCGNCHGGVNPYSENGHHAGGAQEKGKCQQCHSNLPGWDVPAPEMFFMDGYHKPRTGAVICKQMRRFFPRAESFLKHIAENTGPVDFSGMAFLGTRGLNELGQALAFSQPYRPEPPSIPLSEMAQRAQAWVSAMGGEFEGDTRCGCEPVHQAIRTLYVTESIGMGGVIREVGTVGPIDIPLNFHDDRSFKEQGTLPFLAADLVQEGRGGCRDESQGPMKIELSGSAIEEASNNHMHIEAANATPVTVAAAEQCNNALFGSNGPKGGDKGNLKYDLRGRVGEIGNARFPLAGSGKIGILRVRIVDLVSQPANAK